MGFFGVSRKHLDEMEREAAAELSAAVARAKPPTEAERTWVLPSPEVPNLRPPPPPPVRGTRPAGPPRLVRQARPAPPEPELEPEPEPSRPAAAKPTAKPTPKPTPMGGRGPTRARAPVPRPSPMGAGPSRATAPRTPLAAERAAEPEPEPALEPEDAPPTGGIPNWQPPPNLRIRRPPR